VLQQLPIALKQHDTQAYIDSKFAILEKSLPEIQQAEKKLSDSVHGVELQFEKHQKSIVSLLETKILALSKDTADHLQTFGNALDEHLTNLNKTQPSVPTAEPDSSLSADSVSCITSSIANEQYKRARHQLNLIVHNVPEDDPIARKNDDIAKVNELFQKHLGLKIAINNAVRIGKKDLSKTRLLKLTLSYPLLMRNLQS